MFSSINDYADDLLKGERGARYTPIDVAHWIERYAAEAAASLARADRRAADRSGSEYRRAAVDVAVAADLGRFFGAKFRAGVLYRIFEKTGDHAALEQALAQYRAARETWAGIAVRTNGVYAADITVGELRQLRGHWADRLPEIDADIAAIQAKLTSPAAPQTDATIARAVAAALEHPERRAAAIRHTPPARFVPGRALPVEFAAERDYASVRLLYRRVNQAERWQSSAAHAERRLWRAAIPAEYTRECVPASVLCRGVGDACVGGALSGVRRPADGTALLHRAKGIAMLERGPPRRPV